MGNAGRKRKHIPVERIVGIIVILSGIGLCGLLVTRAVKTGTEAFQEAYGNAYERASEEAVMGYYDRAYAKAEADYHVSNRVSVSIGDIQEQSRLEVLKVGDVEYIVQDDDRYKIWIAVPGDGVFTVDMTVSEFLIDNLRHIVIARIPEPKLTEWRVESEAVTIYDFEKGTFGNGNYREGEELARNAMAQGEELIKNEFLSNQDYFTQAKESAKRLVKEFIKNINAEVEDLRVEVEFID